jgi:hypothetical protein
VSNQELLVAGREQRVVSSKPLPQISTYPEYFLIVAEYIKNKKLENSSMT